VLDLRRLAIFREVARAGSFSEAAERLHYSQPAVSHHVSRLELEIGAALLIRRSRGLELTDVGREVLRHADTLLERVHDAEIELRAMVSQEPERVRLGGFQTSTVAVIATALELFWREHPGTRVTVLEADPIEHIDGLRSGRLDLAIVFDHPEGPITVDDRVEVSYLHEDPMLIALPEQHPLAALHEVPLEALRAERWLEGAGPEASSSIFLLRACEAAGFEPEIVFACGNYDAVQLLIRNGMGVAMVPELSVGVLPPGVAVRPPADVSPIRRIGTAALRTRHRPPHLKAMERALAAGFAGYRATRPSLTSPPSPPGRVPTSGPPR
jgi:DNA-binding transcriptional LysR family regulator